MKFCLPWKRARTDMYTTEPAKHYLIFGLGNPGSQYRNNRHNVGFKAVDALSQRLGIKLTRVQFQSIWGSGVYNGNKITLVKPQTFMNQSGQSIAPFVHFYKIPLENILVIYDDMDLPFGTIRMRSAGSSGGHNGMESIIQKLGTQEFPRLRIGIDRPPGKMLGADYVLQDFTNQELAELDSILTRAGDAVLTYIESGIHQAMTDFNGVGEHVE